VIKLTNKKRNYIGISLLFSGGIGFFILMHGLGLFGTSMKGATLLYTLKTSIPWLFMVTCMYGGLWILGDEKTARTQALTLGIPLLIAMIIGYLRWGAGIV
jgi:hypothetical protein